jgi:hypothetical protein
VKRIYGTRRVAIFKSMPVVSLRRNFRRIPERKPPTRIGDHSMTVDRIIFHTRNMLVVIALVGTCGCASIFGGGARPKISIDSTPPGALVTIYDEHNAPVHSETTPFVVRLHQSMGFFSGADYRLVFTLAGYQQAEDFIRPSINGWYFGNFVFGGIIGLLIVDPATGAMWTLHPKRVEEFLQPLPSVATTNVTAAPPLLKEGAVPSEQPQPLPSSTAEPQTPSATNAPAPMQSPTPAEQPATPPAPSEQPPVQPATNEPPATQSTPVGQPATPPAPIP